MGLQAEISERIVRAHDREKYMREKKYESYGRKDWL
jgi:hypothetical protein